MLIASFGVTHLAYPLMEHASLQGEERYQSLVSDIGDNTDSYCKGELKSSQGIGIYHLIPKQLYSQLRRASEKCPPSEPSVVIPVRVTRVVQHDLDAVLLTKKSHGKKSKFIPLENSIDVLDDVIVTKKDRKTKRTVSIGHSKEQVTLSKSVQTSSHTDNSDGDIVVNIETRKARILLFKKRTVIRGRVVTGTRLECSALLTTKNVEIVTLKVSHLAAMDQLHISYGLEHARLVEENSRLKEELAKTQAALETERISNSAHLKNLVDMFAKGSPSSSSCVPPFV
ncbi:hypothetical protein R3W88_016965 [Solanum pinnatisectum]|uniref:Uncharacterized protein n=1 Tax=Solanum pinnatisectum TaxID=50273 RepID=A0AAV9KYU5_9SOLN|nr:hypothetical protein R3W88_016965 [Solanum pinnatisectum]